MLLIPIVGFLYPLLRLAPFLYSWAQRRPIFTLYSELKVPDQELSSGLTDEDREEFSHRLDRLEQRSRLLPGTHGIWTLLYGLRLHINVVRQKAQKSAPPEIREEGAIGVSGT